VVRVPPRASNTATAVPKDPAPTTTARRLRGRSGTGASVSGPEASAVCERFVSGPA
jgi:hypothetical protein